MSSAGRCRKRCGGADGMDAADEASQPLPDAGRVDLRRAAALAREDGEAEAAVPVQGRAAEHQRRHGRNLPLGQFGDEGVLLQDGGIGPAAGAVELGDDRRGHPRCRPGRPGSRSCSAPVGDRRRPGQRSPAHRAPCPVSAWHRGRRRQTRPARMAIGQMIGRRPSPHTGCSASPSAGTGLWPSAAMKRCVADQVPR